MSHTPLGQRLTKDLDPKAIDDVWSRLDARRRAPLRWPFAVAFACAVVALVVLLLRPTPEEPKALHLGGGEAMALAVALTHTTTLDDGSRIDVTRGTLVPTTNDGSAVRFTLPQGHATFDVVPGGPRTWTIDAGLVTVTVLGTRFDVTRGDHEARVSVERGKVLVVGKGVPGGQIVLLAGDHVEVHEGAPPEPPLVPTPGSAEPPSIAPPPEPSSFPDSPDSSTAAAIAPSSTTNARAAVPSTSAQAAEAWHPLAKNGKYSEAYATLGREGVAREARRAERPEELMQVADVARLSGHPADAVLPLERLLENHAGSKVAPQAAFTLGKIELDALGRPGRAAVAFERSIALGVPAALKEDAFARRVEAYAKSNDAARARSSREAYEQAFPNGRYAESVRRLAP